MAADKSLSEWPCKSCKKSIAIGATICPYCRTEYSSEAVKARRKEHNKAMACGALIVLAAILGLGAWLGNDSNGANPPVESASNPADVTPNDPLNGLSDKDKKEFAGGGKIGGQIASTTLKPSPEETAWLDSADDAGLLKAARRTYPDIATIKFIPSADMKDDSETLAMYRGHFYAGLYFAKQIKLADGQSLFDLMTKCGRLTDPTSGAEIGIPDADHKARWINFQFFPTFRREGTNETADMQVLFERDGDRIEARSPMFSSHVLNSPTFMRDHGLRCF